MKQLLARMNQCCLISEIIVTQRWAVSSNHVFTNERLSWSHDAISMRCRWCLSNVASWCIWARDCKCEMAQDESGTRVRWWHFELVISWKTFLLVRGWLRWIDGCALPLQWWSSYLMECWLIWWWFKAWFIVRSTSWCRSSPFQKTLTRCLRCFVALPDDQLLPHIHIHHTTATRPGTSPNLAYSWAKHLVSFHSSLAPDFAQYFHRWYVYYL